MNRYIQLVCMGLIVLLCGLAPVSTRATVVLEIDGGQLTGASGVMIGTIPYHVEFVDASARDIFYDSIDGWMFDFTTPEDADLASQALIDQVLWGLLEPESIQGIDDTGEGWVWTPYTMSIGRLGDPDVVNSSAALLFDDGSVWLSFVGGADADLDLGGRGQDVYADWTMEGAPPAVPEPATVLLLGTGLVGLVGFRKKFKK